MPNLLERIPNSHGVPPSRGPNSNAGREARLGSAKTSGGINSPNSWVSTAADGWMEPTN